MAPSRTHRDPGACVHTPHGALLTPQDHDLILEYADELRGAWPVLAPPRARPRERPEELAPSLRGTRALLPHRCSPTAAPPPLLPSARQVEPLKGAMSRAKHAVGCCPLRRAGTSRRGLPLTRPRPPRQVVLGDDDAASGGAPKVGLVRS